VKNDNDDIKMIKYKLSFLSNKSLNYYEKFSIGLDYLIKNLINVSKDEKEILLRVLFNIEIVYSLCLEENRKYYNDQDMKFVNENLIALNVILDILLERCIPLELDSFD
jgi:hypothetical protein